MNAVVLSVFVMLALSVLRVHVVLALFIGALVGGLSAGLGLNATMVAFQGGLGDGAKLALSYALLGAFAMAVAHSGLPQVLADLVIRKLNRAGDAAARTTLLVKWGLICGVVVMSIMSQNLIPVHIAFIPLLIPPLLAVMTRLRLDRRAIACALTFGLVTTYMFLPLGFGKIFLIDILYGNIEKAGLNLDGVPVMGAMLIPAIGMVVGLGLALFVSYRRPRNYDPEAVMDATAPQAPNPRKVVVALVALVVCFGIQVWLTSTPSNEADPLLIGALVGLCVFIATGAVKWRDGDAVFSGGMRMMALIGLIMITAQGFAAVMKATNQIEPLVDGTAALFAGNKAAAAFAMLLVGLLVTMGIGSSFSTLPIITAIYVPLCVSLGFSPMATVAIVGTAGALGDAGSPASDSTLGPTAGLNADGQHDHIRDTVIPTFIHFNIPLLAAGWVAAMVL